MRLYDVTCEEQMNKFDLSPFKFQNSHKFVIWRQLSELRKQTPSDTLLFPSVLCVCAFVQTTALIFMGATLDASIKQR